MNAKVMDYFGWAQYIEKGKVRFNWVIILIPQNLLKVFIIKHQRNIPEAVMTSKVQEPMTSWGVVGEGTDLGGLRLLVGFRAMRLLAQCNGVEWMGVGQLSANLVCQTSCLGAAYLAHNFPFLWTKQHIHGPLSSSSTLPSSLRHYLLPGTHPVARPYWTIWYATCVPHNFLFRYFVYTPLLSRIHFAFLPRVSKSYSSLIPYCHLLLYNNLFYSVVLIIFLLYLMICCFIFQLFIYTASLFDKKVWEEKYLVQLNLSPKCWTLGHVALYQSALALLYPWYLLFPLFLHFTFFSLFLMTWFHSAWSGSWLPAAVYHVKTQLPLSEFQGLLKFKSAFSVQLHFFLLPAGNSLH